MRKSLAFTLIGVLLGMLLATGGAALFGQSRTAKGGKLSADDWIEIYTLYGKYTHLIDNGEDEGYAYARLWTDDAIFEFGGNKNQGHKKLAEIAMWGIQTPRVVRPVHHAFNIVIEGTPEGAKGSAYLSIIVANKPGEPHTIVTRGIYNDQFVKTSDGWRFKYRKFTPAAFSTEGQTRVVAPAPAAR